MHSSRNHELPSSSTNIQNSDNCCTFAVRRKGKKVEGKFIASQQYCFLSIGRYTDFIEVDLFVESAIKRRNH